MKKIFFTLLLAFAAFSANAQFHFGGQFSINFSNEHTAYSSGLTSNKENAYMINLKPKFYWNLNDKMQIGGSFGFGFGRLTTGLVYESSKPEEQVVINRAIGWSLAPFFGYRLLNWKIVSIWGEANAFFGQNYNVGKQKSILSEWDKSSEYGFQILPVINFDITEKLAVQLHLGIISLGWYGSKSIYPNKVVTSSTWDLHKGGFVGFAQGLMDYGIGIVRNF